MKKIFSFLTFVTLSITSFSQTILETLSNHPELSRLTDKIIEVHLDDELSGPGPYTIFAPTNYAFEIVSITESANLSGGIFSLLLNTVNGHIVQDSITSNNFILNQNMNTLFADQFLTIDSLTNDYSITNNFETASIDTLDIICSNGVIHIINRVLILNLTSVQETINKRFNLQNPVNDRIFLKSSETSQVDIISMNGQVIFSQQFSGDINISTDFISTGLYFLSIKMKEENYILKFFK